MGLPNIAEQPSIWIVYANSPDDSMELAAQTISEEMNSAGCSIQETIFDRLDIIPSNSDAIVLVGHGHLEGLEVAGILVSWGEVDDILIELKSQMIILLACNSPSNPDSNIFGFSGQIDAKAGALLSAWKILHTISPQIQHNIQFEASFEAQTNMKNPLGTCVYFVHGYLGNDETFFNMIDTLNPSLRVNYGSENILKFSYFDAYQNLTKLEVHNLEGGISTYAEDFLNRILSDNHPIGTQIDIVGYSLGGLITREMLRLYRPNLQSEGIDVGRVITLGTPHNGTPMASSTLISIGVTYLNSFFTGETWSTPVFHSVNYGTPFISTLNSDPESYSNDIKWYTIAGDNLGTFYLLGLIFFCANDGIVPTFSAGLSYAEDSII
ncbi:MAG: esterase/lipase family protein, partial [Candidatus Thorarchaeota archaeon]